jgi:hypothetical protein
MEALKFSGAVRLQCSNGLNVPTEVRPLYTIAKEIKKDWKNMYFGAVPYVEALLSLDKLTDRYYFEDARNQVVYLLGNMRTWKGETAKRIKLELNQMLKAK